MRLDYSLVHPNWTANISPLGRSQKGEDVSLKWTFDNIGTTNKYYVEFGAIDGFLECEKKNREYPLSNKYGWRHPTDKEIEYLKITGTEKRIIAQNIRASSLNHKACTFLFGDSVIKGPYSPKKSM